MSENITYNKDILKDFGILFAIMVPLLFGILFPTLFDESSKSWPWVTGWIFAIFSIAAPQLLKWVYIPWMKIAHVLGIVNTHVLLFIVYFLLVTPIGLIRKLLGKTIELGPDSEVQTYRKTIDNWQPNTKNPF